MFETVGRYRDPEATFRRLAAGCLTALLAWSAIFGTLLFWLAVWLWPYFLQLCRWIVAILLRLIFGQETADLWLAQQIVEAPPVEIAAIDVELGEPYVEDDPPLLPAPLPGEAIPPPPEPLDATGEIVEIAHLRGWNDDDDFVQRAMLTEELAAMDMAVLGALSSDSGSFASVLSAGEDYESGIGGLIGSADWGELEGAGGLGLSGVGMGGGGSAEGLGGLGTKGHGSGSGYGSGVAIGSRRDREREKPREEVEEVLAVEMATLGYLEKPAEVGGLIGDVAYDEAEWGVEGGVAGGVEGGVVGGVIGGVVGGTFSDTSPPVALHVAEPDYPEAARSEGLEATCTAKVRVAEDGRGKIVTLSGCPNQFRGAVIDAIGRSTWSPARRDGAPVEETVTVRFSFVNPAE
jgi:hypothetical protein